MCLMIYHLHLLLLKELPLDILARPLFGDDFQPYPILSINGIQRRSKVVEIFGDLLDIVVEYVSVLQACKFLFFKAVSATSKAMLVKEGHPALYALEDWLNWPGDGRNALLHKDGSANSHALEEVVLVKWMVDETLDGVAETAQWFWNVSKEAHARDQLQNLLMVVALLQIVPFQLSKEDGHQLLLLLDLEAPKFQLDIF